MTAVNLLQLRKQINSLLWTFMDPEQFRRSLLSLFEQYTDLAYKPGKGAVTSIRTTDLNIPPLVLRELEIALYQSVREHPQAALALCDLLWQDPHTEMKIIAARMLGQLPSEFIDDVLQRIENWTAEQRDPFFEKVFLENGTASIRRNEPDKLMQRAKEWCENKAHNKKKTGLQALIILADDQNYINLPAIFNALELLFLDTPAALQSDIIDLMTILLKRSPVETAFFIRQMLERSATKTVVRISRKMLPLLPPESQPAIAALLRTIPVNK